MQRAVPRTNSLLFCSPEIDISRVCYVCVPRRRNITGLAVKSKPDPFQSFFFFFFLYKTRALASFPFSHLAPFFFSKNNRPGRFLPAGFFKNFGQVWGEVFGERVDLRVAEDSFHSWGEFNFCGAHLWARNVASAWVWKDGIGDKCYVMRLLNFSETLGCKIFLYTKTLGWNIFLYTRTLGWNIFLDIRTLGCDIFLYFKTLDSIIFFHIVYISWY